MEKKSCLLNQLWVRYRLSLLGKEKALPRVEWASDLRKGPESQFFHGCVSPGRVEIRGHLVESVLSFYLYMGSENQTLVSGLTWQAL